MRNPSQSMACSTHFPIGNLILANIKVNDGIKYEFACISQFTLKYLKSAFAYKYWGISVNLCINASHYNCFFTHAIQLAPYLEKILWKSLSVHRSPLTDSSISAKQEIQAMWFLHIYRSDGGVAEVVLVKSMLFCIAWHFVHNFFLLWAVTARRIRL